MPAAHAKFSPSSAVMWIGCPGSIQMCEGMEEQRDSEPAAEGTVAHHVRECVLAFGFELEDFLFETLAADGFEFEVDEDMIEHLRPGIEWVQERPGKLFNEFRVNLSRWMPDQFGTLDVGIVAPDLITINDHKYGQQVPVLAVENLQLKTYALGFWDNVARHETDATDFLLHVDQPRAPTGGGEWRTTLDDLMEHGERLTLAYEEAMSDDPPLRPGKDQCWYCLARDTCPAYAQWSLEHADAILDDLDDIEPFEEMTLADAEKFTPERRAVVATNADAIERWIKAVKERVLADAIAGEPTPGLKAVAGRRSAKKWLDDEKAKKFLLKRASKKMVMTAPQLISPTQAESVIPKPDQVEMKKLWFQAEGKPVLVAEDDPKPAINRTAQLDDLD